ncbi:unnamed protein product [Brassica oleracea var. botrytis]
MLDCIVQIHRRSSTRLSRSKQHTHATPRPRTHSVNTYYWLLHLHLFLFFKTSYFLQTTSNFNFSF